MYKNTGPIKKKSGEKRGMLTDTRKGVCEDPRSSQNIFRKANNGVHEIELIQEKACMKIQAQFRIFSAIRTMEEH